ncbi:MAG: hypothetical protein NC489_23980 [Ruminococcus flavefaciens]|nr:hypothetical protein [Ruminococcus flavefaciens]
MGKNRKKHKSKRHKSKKQNRNVTTAVQETKEEKINIPKLEGNTLSFFYDVIVLMVSLLHGTLFFLLADRMIELINNFTVLELSFLVFFFSLFLRIFQTHILAAVKYTEKWVFRPMDFVMVFFTAFFEYLLINNKRITNRREEWYYYVIFAFCLFGVIGYIITYRRTYKQYNGIEKSAELHIQIINIVCIIVVGILNLFNYFHIFPKYITVPFVNFFPSGVLLFNIYLSLRLSKEQIKDLIKIK